jgi:hypothetical protein
VNLALKLLSNIIIILFYICRSHYYLLSILFNFIVVKYRTYGISKLVQNLSVGSITGSLLENIQVSLQMAKKYTLLYMWIEVHSVYVHYLLISGFWNVISLMMPQIYNSTFPSECANTEGINFVSQLQSWMMGATVSCCFTFSSHCLYVLCIRMEFISRQTGQLGNQ